MVVFGLRKTGKVCMAKEIREHKLEYATLVFQPSFQSWAPEHIVADKSWSAFFGVMLAQPFLSWQGQKLPYYMHYYETIWSNIFVRKTLSLLRVLAAELAFRMLGISFRVLDYHEGRPLREL